MPTSIAQFPWGWEGILAPPIQRVIRQAMATGEAEDRPFLVTSYKKF
jgi:hypothetical protein